MTEQALAPMKVATLNIETVAISDIYVDDDYQRPEVKSHVAGIAKNFSLDQYGVPMLGRRASGRLYCVNGRQRIAAASASGYTHVQAHVFDSAGKRDEAQRFTRANRDSRKISGVYWHRANVIAEHPAALWIEGVLGSYGLTALPEGSARCRVMATGILYRIHAVLGEPTSLAEAERCLRFALDVMNPLWGGEYPARDWVRLNLVGGLAWAAHTSQPVTAEQVRARLTAGLVTPTMMAEAVTNIGNGSQVHRYAERTRDYVNSLGASALLVPIPEEAK